MKRPLKYNRMKTQIISLLLAIFTLQGYAQKTVQNFFEPITLPEGNNGFYDLNYNSTGEIFLGVSTGLYKSSDNGDTWDSLPWSGYAVTVEINMQNNDMFVGYPYGVKFSNDYGESWQQTAHTYATSRTLLTKSQNLICATWGCIYKMNYEGTEIATTLTFEQNIQVRDIIEHPAGFLMAGLMARGGYNWYSVHRSFDNGSTWENTGMDYRQVWSLAVNSLGDIYSGQQQEFIYGLYKSIDLGLSWDFILEGLNIHKVYITPDDDIYLGCSSDIGPFGGVKRSTDNGKTWEVVLTESLLIIDRMRVSQNWTLFCGSSSRGLFRSTQTVWDSTYRVRMTIEPENAGTVTGVDSYFHGTTASLSAIPDTNYRFDHWEVNRQPTTTDSILNLGMVRPMYVTAHFTKIAAVNNVTDIKLKVFPNPFSNKLTIENMPKGSRWVKIYDTTGKLISSQNITEPNFIELNTALLPAGVYFVTVGNNYCYETQQIVKL